MSRPESSSQEPSPQRLEVEVKVRFAGPVEARRAILAAGGEETRSRHFEDNQVFDTPSGDLAARGALLRVRSTSDGREEMTYKEKAGPDVGAKVRSEWEVQVSPPDQLAGILCRAGFVRTYRYQKYRTVFRLGPATVDLDETPMGCFVEIEASAEELPEVAARIGGRAGELLVEDYRTLHQSWCAERGLPATDMVFPGGATEEGPRA